MALGVGQPVVEGARRVVTLANGLEHAIEAFGRVFEREGAGFRRDPRLELFGQRRTGREQDDGPKHGDRQRERRRIENGQPEADAAEHPDPSRLTVAAATRG